MDLTKTPSPIGKFNTLLVSVSLTVNVTVPVPPFDPTNLRSDTT
nr:MAG TPA: hypothetical protein [Caudoviricetes sp.]